MPTQEPKVTKPTKHSRQIARLLELMDKETQDSDKPADRALWHLLKRWEDRLPELDGYFHKAFRQMDVTDDGHTDMAIWNLIHHSKTFWRLFEEVQTEKTTKP